ELDIWRYIKREAIPVPSIYFSHKREVVLREGNLYAHSPFMPLGAGEKVEVRTVRFRTVGDMTCTGAVESAALTIDEVIDEVAGSRLTERGTRIDDQRSETAMEDRKKGGYF
ncbi:MAG: phosphoadenosine phosphosulfate reductase family protein, partial [Bacteroidota bacterium]